MTAVIRKIINAHGALIGSVLPSEKRVGLSGAIVSIVAEPRAVRPSELRMIAKVVA